MGKMKTALAIQSTAQFTCLFIAPLPVPEENGSKISLNLDGNMPSVAQANFRECGKNFSDQHFAAKAEIWCVSSRELGSSLQALQAAASISFAPGDFVSKIYINVFITLS